MGRKAVYYMAVEDGIDHVALPVFRQLKELVELKELDLTIDEYPVLEYCNESGDEFIFVRTKKVVCHDYNRYLPYMNSYFEDAEMAGLVTWHEGGNAPEKIFTVHTTGDVESGNFGAADPRYMHNILLSLEKHRKNEGLEDYFVTTEATHWSGMMYGNGGPELITQYSVPIMDIEIGSIKESWNDPIAARVISKALIEVFNNDDLELVNVLCAGGTHFDRAFSSVLFDTWEGKSYGISHIIPNQWLVSGKYEEQTGLEKLLLCVNSIKGGIRGIAMHDGLKGVYKDRLRELGKMLEVPVFKHQQLRRPEVIDWAK